MHSDSDATLRGDYDGETYTGPGPARWDYGEPIRCDGRMNAVPYNLELAYGKIRARFDKTTPIVLGPFSVSVAEKGNKTEIFMEGENVEPDGDVTISYYA